MAVDSPIRARAAFGHCLQASSGTFAIRILPRLRFGLRKTRNFKLRMQRICSLDDHAESRHDYEDVVLGLWLQWNVFAQIKPLIRPAGGGHDNPSERA